MLNKKESPAPTVNERPLHILTRNANQDQIGLYFYKILNLTKSGQRFPVNLDEVWPLAYPRKDHAVRTLTSDFVEGVDYQLLLKNGERSYKATKGGGHNRVDYMLSVQCLEYFIAKKVKPVFEVYRRVFHQAINKLIHGQHPVNVDGSLFIDYSTHMKKLKLSTTSGSASSRRRRNPQEFCFYNGNWKVSVTYASYMEEMCRIRNQQAKLRERRNQFLLQQKQRQLLIFENMKGARP